MSLDSLETATDIGGCTLLRLWLVSLHAALGGSLAPVPAWDAVGPVAWDSTGHLVLNHSGHIVESCPKQGSQPNAGEVKLDPPHDMLSSSSR